MRRRSERLGQGAAPYRAPSSFGALSLALALLLAGCTTADTVALLLEACGTDADCPPELACDRGACVPREGQQTLCGLQPSTPPPEPLLCAPSSRSFPFGLCVCDDHVSAAPLELSAFDSRDLSADGDDEAGSFGVNGDMNVTEAVTVGGALTVAGAGGIVASEPARVLAGALRSQGGLRGPIRIAVTGDAEVGGDIDVAELTVGGMLHLAEEARIATSAGEWEGDTVRRPVQIELPCPCEPAAHPDIRARIHTARTENDNALAELDPFLLDGFDEPQALHLGCGRYHLSRIAGSAPLELTIAGAVQLFIDSEIALDEDLLVTLEPDARLDLFVDESLRVSRTLRLGERKDAGRVRVFLGGGGTIALGADSLVAGLLHAPAAELVSQGNLEVLGALFVRRSSPQGAVTVRQDAALAAPWGGCEG